jgi:hypothetical protein
MALTQRRVPRASRRPTNAPLDAYAAHAEEAAAARDAAKTTEAREHHDRAWAAHMTASNMHKNLDRLARRAQRLRADAGWQASRRPSQRQWVVHPVTKRSIPAHEYLLEQAQTMEASHAFTRLRAVHHHEQGMQHSAKGHAADAAREIPHWEKEAAEGEITDPNFVPEMEQAAEVVTDQPADEKPTNGKRNKE